MRGRDGSRTFRLTKNRRGLTTQSMMTNPKQNSTDRLMQMLHELQSLVERLSQLAAQQSQFIDAGKTEALLTVLGSRQEVIDQFVASQAELTTLLEQLPSDRDRGSDHSRQQIEELVKTINGELAQVMERDSEDQKRLESRRDRTRNELDGVGTAKRAHQAYFKSHPVTNRFADRQG